MRQTHTYAGLGVSPAAHEEIRAALEKAGYQHLFVQQPDGVHIAMGEIGLIRDEAIQPAANSPGGGPDQPLTAKQALHAAVQHPYSLSFSDVIQFLMASLVANGEDPGIYFDHGVPMVGTKPVVEPLPEEEE